MRTGRKSQAVISMEEKLKQWREAKNKKDTLAIEKAAASRSAQESNTSSGGSTTGSIDSGDRNQSTRGRGRNRDEKTLGRSKSSSHNMHNKKGGSVQSGGSVDSLDKNASSGQTKLLGSALEPSYTGHTKSSAMKDKVPDRRRRDRSRSRSRHRSKVLARSTRPSTIHITLDAEEDSNTKENPVGGPNSAEEGETREEPQERQRTIAFSASTDQRDTPGDDKKHVTEATKDATAKKAEAKENATENPGGGPNSTEKGEARKEPQERQKKIAFSASTDQRDTPSDDKKHVTEATKKATAKKTEAKENETENPGGGQNSIEKGETREEPLERQRTIAFSASTDQKAKPSDDKRHVTEATEKATVKKTEAKENETENPGGGPNSIEKGETGEQPQERQRTISFSASTDQRDTPSDDKKHVTEATKKATAKKTEAKENEESAHNNVPEGKYNKIPQSSVSGNRAANPFQEIDSDTNACKGQNRNTKKASVSPLSPEKPEPAGLSPKKQNPVKEIETDPIPKSTENDTTDLVDAVSTPEIITEENVTSIPFTVLEHFESFARTTKEYVRSPTPMVRSPTPMVRSPTPMVRSPTPMVRSPSPLSEDEIRATFIRKRDRLRNRRRRQSFSESGPLSPRSFSLLDEDDEEEEEDETPTIVKTLDEIIPIPTRTIRMAEIEVEEEGIETIQYQDSNSSDENDSREDAESCDNNIKEVDPEVLPDNNIQPQPQVDNITEARSQHDYDRLAVICRMYRDGHKQVRGLNGILKAEKSDADERLRMLSGAYEMKLKQFNKMSSELTAIRRENSILQGGGGNEPNMHKLIFDLKRQMMTGLSAAVERNKKLEAQLSQARAAVKELKSRLPPDDDWIKHGALEI